METRSIYPVDLEYRQGRGGRGIISGSFPYGQLATIGRAGRVRKERFSPKAFDFAINQEPEREINFLSGHSMNRPLASRRAGTLELDDRVDVLAFEATMPVESEQPSWVVDFLLARRAGLVGGISPGFLVPPRDVVPDAEYLEPEPGNPGVMIRVIRHAVLTELSAVTRPAYDGTELTERSSDALDTAPYWQLDMEMLRWL